MMSSVIRDAETGEPIKFTKSKWDAVEGRVNLDYRSVILMGTGAMCIKSTANGTGLTKDMLFDMTEDNGDVDGDEELSFKEEDNPLFIKFMREGPQNIMSHERYNVKTGKVDPDPKILRQERRKRREELRLAEEANKQRLLKEQEELSLGTTEKEIVKGVLDAWQGVNLFSNTPPVTGISTPNRRSPKKDATNDQLSLPSIDCSVIRAQSPGVYSGYSSPASTPDQRQFHSRSRSKSTRLTPSRRSPKDRRKGKGSRSVNSMLSDDSRLNSGRSDVSTQSKRDEEHNRLQEVLFNELFNKASEIDRIRNPLPMLHNKSQDEVDKIYAEDEKRRLILVDHCKELA